MGDVLLQLGELLLDVVHKRRAAGAGEGSPSPPTLCTPHRPPVGAQGGLHHVEEAQLLDAGDHLAQLGVGELLEMEGAITA